jgi:2-hydroxychromene-2-carboxylate isomerase
MLLGGVFKATGNQTPANIPAKGKYVFMEIERYARQYEVAFAMNPHFPIITLALMRGAVSYQMNGNFERYLRTCFEAIWVQPRDMNDPGEVAAVLQANGFDAQDFTARISDPAVKEVLKANTEEAVERGVFGAPSFFVGEQMFFDQDRLEWAREALR